MKGEAKARAQQLLVNQCLAEKVSVSDNVLYREAGGWRGQQVSDRQFGLAA
jgi:hypothetical protein